MGNEQRAGGTMSNDERRLIVETLGEMCCKSASVRIYSMEFASQTPAKALETPPSMADRRFY